MRLNRQDLHRLLDRIEFTKHQPHDKLEAKPPKWAKWELVRFGDKDDEVRATLAPLRDIRGMSTLANAYLIHEITKFLDPGEAYLNVGVWQGFTFLAGVINRECISIGVDNFSAFGGPREQFLANFEPLRHSNTSFFDMDYVEYLTQRHDGRKIGFYFYDGEHSYKNQLRALEIAEPFFAPNAIILVDDTNTKPARQATLDFVLARHGQYEIILDQLTSRNGHPTFHNGLIFLRAVS
jgi:Methyltransferase domain